MIHTVTREILLGSAIEVDKVDSKADGDGIGSVQNKVLPRYLRLVSRSSSFILLYNHLFNRNDLLLLIGVQMVHFLRGELFSVRIQTKRATIRQLLLFPYHTRAGGSTHLYVSKERNQSTRPVQKAVETGNEFVGRTEEGFRRFPEKREPNPWIEPCMTKFVVAAFKVHF